MNAPRVPPHLLLWVCLLSSGCGGAARTDLLQARESLLLREVARLRSTAGDLERHEPLLPAGDLVVSVDDSLARELLAAELPIDADIDRFHVSLTSADVRFHGSPLVRLKGRVALRDTPSLTGNVELLGSIENILIDPGSDTLQARLQSESVHIESVNGLEPLLGGWTLEELAQIVERSLVKRLPLIQIPVRVQEKVELAALTAGPVRIRGAAMPIQVRVSRVLAAQGRLWIGLHLTPGDVGTRGEGP